MHASYRLLTVMTDCAQTVQHRAVPYRGDRATVVRYPGLDWFSGLLTLWTTVAPRGIRYGVPEQ